MNEGTLHIYEQDNAHDEAFIVGDVRGLISLRDAINRALVSVGQTKSDVTQAFQVDGEGFALYVVCTTEERMKGLPPAYIDMVDGPFGAEWAYLYDLALSAGATP